MGEESFVLVSLEEDKAKKLAQVLSNDTARKILDHLSKKESATETEIAKDMDISLSTVHYNLQALVEAELVDDSSFTYSKKGKQIIHYSLPNKYVIIAPKNKYGLMDKLKSILPVALFTGIVAVGIRYMDFLKGIINPVNMKTEIATYDALAAGAGEEMMLAADVGTRALPQIAREAAQAQDFALWFMAGSLVTLTAYFVWAEIILKKK